MKPPQKYQQKDTSPKLLTKLDLHKYDISSNSITKNQIEINDPSGIYNKNSYNKLKTI